MSKTEETIENLRKNKGVSFAEADIILNLIEKQQKEIEELKFKNKNLDNLLQGQLYDYYKYYKELANSYQANSISKDKIRERIKMNEELIKKPSKWKYTENEIRNFKIENLCLEELLEE